LLQQAVALIDKVGRVRTGQRAGNDRLVHLGELTEDVVDFAYGARDASVGVGPDALDRGAGIVEALAGLLLP
jgi:hypothetical protein